MSCFAMRTSSASRIGGSRQPWRWRWWRKCAGLAAAAHTKLRRSVQRVRWSATGRLGSQRRRAPTPPLPSVSLHHRSFSPVYVDELYGQPKGLSVVHEEQPSTSKLARADPGGGGVNKARVVHGVAGAAATGGSKARAAAAAAKSLGMRGFLLSPNRGMGEVDVRAEMFIRKFREEMRLQSQRSAEELQAMLARGL